LTDLVLPNDPVGVVYGDDLGTLLLPLSEILLELSNDDDLDDVL